MELIGEPTMYHDLISVDLLSSRISRHDSCTSSFPLTLVVMGSSMKYILYLNYSNMVQFLNYFVQLHQEPDFP